MARASSTQEQDTAQPTVAEVEALRAEYGRMLRAEGERLLREQRTPVVPLWLLVEDA